MKVIWHFDNDHKIAWYPGLLASEVVASGTMMFINFLFANANHHLFGVPLGL